jgi:hypothetical protein
VLQQDHLELPFQDLELEFLMLVAQLQEEPLLILLEEIHKKPNKINFQ